MKSFVMHVKMNWMVPDFLPNWETDKFFNFGYAKIRILNSKFMRFAQEKIYKGLREKDEY